VIGTDHNPWYTKDDSVSRITTTGAVTEFPTPTQPSGTEGIAVGADETIWFTENAANKIGRISP
jgi:virginiamycin B lyase